MNRKADKIKISNDSNCLSSYHSHSGREKRGFADHANTDDIYRLIFESTSDAIVYIGSAGEIINLNSRTEEIFHIDVEKLVGENFVKIGIFSEIDNKRLSVYINSMLSGKSREMLELELTLPNGDLAYIEINSRIMKKEGEITGLVINIRDITERKCKEDLLRKNDEKFKTFFANANDGIIYLDSEAIIRASNKKIEELFGYSREDVIGKQFTEFDNFPPAEMENIFELFQESIEGKIPPLVEFEGFHNNGNKFFLEINPTLIKDDDELIGVLAIIRDVTSRKSVEDERARLIDIIEATPDFVFTYDANGNISYINRAGREILGITRGGDLTLVSFPGIQETISIVMEKGIWMGESNLVSKDGNIIQVSQVFMAHRGSERKAPYYSAIMRDITEQKQNEKHIKYLTHQLIKVQEDERLRISRDLHDNLAQDLSSLKILCETLFDYNPDVPDHLKNKISGMSKIFQRSIDSVRDLTYNLRPAILDQLGLMNTIYQYCEEFHDKNDIDVEFYSAGMKSLKLDFDTEINIFRIVQEALNNIKKHAQANCVKVNLISSYPTIILQIEDNGDGFELKKRKKELINEKRMGLKSIEERVGLLKGKFRIQSKKKLGTRIHVEVPYKERVCGEQGKCNHS